MIKRITVFGRVQGVFYREKCRQKAQELGIKGSARNKEDGTVEVIACGSDEQVQQLVEWCRKGPDLAMVEKVDVEDFDESRLPGMQGFVIGW